MTARSARVSAAGVAGVGLLTAILWWAQRRLTLPDVTLLYLPLVLAAALFGAVPGIVTAAASTLAFHVFFTNPQASFRVAAFRDVLTILVYVATTSVITLLIAQIRANAAEAERRADVANALQQLGAAGLALPSTDAPERVAEAVAAVVGSPGCILWMRDGSQLREWATFGLRFTDRERDAAASWAERQGGSVTVLQRGGPSVRFLPIRAVAGVSGAIALQDNTAAARLLDDARFVEGLSGFVSLLWSRAATASLELEAAAAKRSDDLKTALLSMVSHELRSPLTAIKATVQGLLDDPDAAAVRDGLVAVEHESVRLERLVRNLLDASRVEAGALRPATHPVRLRRLVGELADRLHADVRLEVPADLRVDADPVLLEQVFRNLIENVERHGRPPILVRAERDVGIARVCVSDAGPGVDAADLPYVFDRFSRRGRGGLGLGLTLCRAVVEAHGGTIAAANAPDGGFVVTFTLHAVDTEALP